MITGEITVHVVDQNIVNCINWGVKKSPVMVSILGNSPNKDTMEEYN